MLDAINHIRNGTEWATNVLKVDDFISDVQSGKLAQVTWMTPLGPNSDHPPANVCNGEGWTVQVLNAIMSSQFWNSTAVFVVWDDHGGYYDHVPPPTLDFWGLGIRTPLLILSPYVKAGTVQHAVYESSSMLAFVEKVFDLPPLSQRDKKADNLMDAFDFTQSPLPPLILTPNQCSDTREGPIVPLEDDDGD